MKRPSDDQIERVLSFLRGGATVEQAARYCELDPEGFDAWVHRPRNRRVAVRIQNALAQADLADMAVIKEASTTRADAASGTWQAAKARVELRKESERERQLYRLRALTVD